MDILKLNFVDMHFLSSFGIIFIIFSVFYWIASSKNKNAIAKVSESLKLQEKANQQLGNILSEIRRSNQFLADLAGLEPLEYPEENQVTTGASTSQSGHQHKLYVGNIDYTATESELAGYFAQYGQVEFVNIPVNRYTGKARGFGFVTFTSLDDAKRAMVLNGAEFKGRQIQVNFAKERDAVQ